MLRSLILALCLFVIPISIADVRADDPLPAFTSHTFALVPPLKGFAHGCAVNGLTLTNRHVVDFRKGPEEELRPVYFRYGFGEDGDQGRGRSNFVSKGADLAVVLLDLEPKSYAPRAKQGPAPGDKVLWVEFDFRKRDKVFKSRLKEGKVLRTFAGHVVLEEEITRGASGGCAYNEAGEVLGIMAFGVETNDMKVSAGFVALWGPWWQDVQPEAKP